MNVKKNFQMKMWLALFISIVFSTMSFSLNAAEEEKMIEHETGFYYTVQKGDTLWDLSQKFSDSAWLWPEMWKENSQIANPHRIYPGERIRLYRRTGAQKITEKKVGAPVTLTIPRPPIEQIFYNYTGLDRVGFVRKEPLEAHGAIFKVQKTREMISTDDVVYIRPENDVVLSTGKRYTIYRPVYRIRERYSNAYVGVQYLLTGVVEITQIQPSYAIGTVVVAYRPIEVEDRLMPYNRRLPTVSMKESPKGLQGQIIEAEEHNRLIGEHMIAFINKGKKDGVQPGQFYNVYYQEEEKTDPKKSEKTLLLPVEIAELLVLHTESTTATVIITGADREFEAGAPIRSPNQ